MRQRDINFFGLCFFFLGFELVLSCKSFWQHLLEGVSCSPSSGYGSLGFVSISSAEGRVAFCASSGCLLGFDGTDHPLSLPRLGSGSA